MTPPKAVPQRGDIWLTDFGSPVGHEPSGPRPAVIVSANGLNEGRSGVVIAVPCTTTPRGLPSHIELDPEVTGLREVTYARCEDVKSVSDERLRRRLGAAHPEAMFAVSTALRYLLDL